MSLTKDLSSAVQKHLAEEGKSNIPGTGTPLTQDFEQWLSYLVEAPPWLPDSEQTRNEAAFYEVSRGVASILETEQTNAVSEPPPSWLQPLVIHWVNNDATVITLNYDVLVELACKVFAAGVICYDSWDSTLNLYPVPITPIGIRGGHGARGLRPPEGLQLVKLHGSLNWRYSGPRGTPVDAIYGGPLNGREWNAEGLEWLPPFAEQLAVDLQHMIVPPTAVKGPYYRNQTLQALWRFAAKAIREARELVMVGFSLPQTDMLVSSLLSTNLPSDSRITPVNPTDRILARIRWTFDMSDNDTRLNDQFIGDNAVQRWVNDLTRD